MALVANQWTHRDNKQAAAVPGPDRRLARRAPCATPPTSGTPSAWARPTSRWAPPPIGDQPLGSAPAKGNGNGNGGGGGRVVTRTITTVYSIGPSAVQTRVTQITARPLTTRTAARSSASARRTTSSLVPDVPGRRRTTMTTMTRGTEGGATRPWPRDLPWTVPGTLVPLYSRAIFLF